MERKFSFKSESAASKFAKEVSEAYSRETTVKGTEVSVSSGYPKKEDKDSQSMRISEMQEELYRFESYMYEEMDIMNRAMWRMEEGIYDYLYNHNKGHIPAIADAGKMKQALQVLGLEDSFEIRKPVISMSSNSSGVKVIDVE